MRGKGSIPELTPERQALVTSLGAGPEQHAESIARSEGALHLLDELKSCARMAATRAAATYVPVPGATFADLAKHHIRGAVYDFLRHEGRQQTFRRAADLAARCAYWQVGPEREDVVDARKDDEVVCGRKLDAYVGAKMSAIAVAFWLAAEAAEPDPEETAALRPFLDAMRAGVSALRPSDQELLRLVYAEGLDLKEAAVEVKLAYPTAKVRHRKILGRLREDFEKRRLDSL